MPKHRNPGKKSFFKAFLQYGFHLWILLLVSNFLIFYSFSLFSFGQTHNENAAESPLDNPAEISEAVDEPSPTSTRFVKREPTKAKKPKPKGPALNLAFSVPGIGSGGGNMKPKRTTRDLFVFLYAKDVNSYDNNVRPIYTIRSKAVFDENKISGTYTSFVNEEIDLGDTVKNGKYQVVFSTNQSLRKLVKDKENAVGGMILDLRIGEKTKLPLQAAIMGDITPPQGDNLINIADYNLFASCYGKETPCAQINEVDLNDDGKIDGIDYNILARGYQSIHELGMPVPSLATTPQPTEEAKPTAVAPTEEKKAPEPSPSPVVKTKSSGGAGGIIGFFVFLIILGIGGFVLAKSKFGKAFLQAHPLPFPILKGKPGNAQEETKPADGQNPATETPAEASTDAQAAPPAETPPADASTEAIAESTEIPIESLQAEKAAADASPAETPPAAAANTVDKTYYVKNKSKDDKGTWVVLTDDAGPIDGLLTNGTIEDGFERIKGTITEENGKKYILISEVLPSE